MTNRLTSFPLIFALCLPLLLVRCHGGDEDGRQASAGLPFEVTRPDQGHPLTAEEVEAFTHRIVAAWKKADIFDYLRAVTYGVARDHPRERPYYSVFWTGVRPVKEGDTITFKHLKGGSAENIMIPNPVLLTNVIAAYKFSGDERLALLADELARGISAQFMGCVWSENVAPEDRHIMARSTINNNYIAYLDDGRRYSVDYTDWRIVDTSRWNTHFVRIPNNPYWGDIYIQNMRSKDDVCHLFRAAGLLEHFLDVFDDPDAKAGINSTYLDLKAFARDIVDQGFKIRSVDHGGDIFIPDIDLASFVYYGKKAECQATLAAQLFAYGNEGDVECGNGRTGLYEVIATASHMYNYDIIRNFHMAALLHSLNARRDDVARALMQGLVERSDEDMGKIEGHFDEPGDQERFNGDLASNLPKYAACGLPLTSEEVRFVHQYYDVAIEVWNDWDYWDLWDDSVPDGEHPYKPGTRIDFHDMTSFLPLCASPYYNDSGAEVVDCDIIRDSSNWGY